MSYPCLVTKKSDNFVVSVAQTTSKPMSTVDTHYTGPTIVKSSLTSPESPKTVIIRVSTSRSSVVVCDALTDKAIVVTSEDVRDGDLDAAQANVEVPSEKN